MAGLGFVVSDILIPLVIIPDRDAVSPPDLTGDTPVADIFHPVHINFGPAVRIECDTPVGHGLDSFAEHRVFQETRFQINDVVLKPYTLFQRILYEIISLSHQIIEQVQFDEEGNPVI